MAGREAVRDRATWQAEARPPPREARLFLPEVAPVSLEVRADTREVDRAPLGVTVAAPGLEAILGLTSYQGELKVLGRDPWTERDRLMRDVCFIADVAVLPRWMRVSQALDYVAGVHPRFDRAKAEGFLAKSAIQRDSKVRHLSKGMVTQLHLALVMAIDAHLLVLDEPTLGLDLLVRKQFYDSLLDGYFDRRRTIVVATHQVEEIQDVLTDLLFIDRGRIVLACSMEEVEARYLEVMVHPEHVAAARALAPIRERQLFGRSILLFDGADRQQLAALGDVRTPSIADLFVAVVGAAR
jgi:ABC-2 type transport system ATP-binding protein